MAKIIKANGEVVFVEPKNGTDFSYEELSAFVGGYIEIVHINKNEIMVVNEEGKILGLPINDVATFTFGYRDTIVGDALVCRTEQVK